jgi:type III pantothenate kinase
VTESGRPHNLLALSIGNSNLHLALASGTEIVRHASVPLDPWPPSTDLLSELLEFAERSGGVECGVMASVRPDLVEAIEGMFASVDVPIRKVGVDFPVPITNLYECPGEVGIDRLLGVLAASRLFPGQGVVVVDFGTALTFNVGSPDGEFLGGLIGLGASSAAIALPERTPMLPRVELSEAAGFVARDTERAINDGIFWGIAGGVERVLDGLRGELPFEFRCIATGGDAALIVPAVRGVDRLEEQLVLGGVCVAYREAGSLPPGRAK